MANASSSKGIFSTMVSDGNSANISEVADQVRGLGQDQLRILNVIDNLRSATLEEVKLPQLVVVGDQSAGKSSVLDAISGIPIPKHPDGCTRFATEFRLRRGSNNISIGIIPSKSRTAEDRYRLSQLNVQVTDIAQLSNLIRKCERAIFDGDKPGQRKFASRDIMTIDICGPTMPLLTLVDLPGFIHAPNNKQTAEDIAAINDIAVDYMSRPRTVILAVVAGSSDYATQVVLKNALECDKGGVRTLGIVTKPDLTSGIGLEEKFLKLVKNEDIKLNLGWHVLRNRAPSEINMQTEARNQKEEEFFTQGKWATLRRGTCGVESLVAKLSVLLYAHITEYFPQLLKEIKEELERSEEELHALGRRVDTESEMLSDLSKLFSLSQSLIESGISGHYLDQRGFIHIGDNESFKQISSRNLRACIRQENIEFEKEIRTRGCQVRFVGKGAPDTEYDNPKDADSEEMEHYERITVQKYLDTYVGQHLPGDYDPSIVFHLFADYSAKWDNIAHNHQDKVQGVVNQFLQQVVNHVWPQRMRTRLWSTLLSKKVEVLQTRAKEELERLLLDRRRCYPIYGPEYPRRLKELQDSSASENIPPAREIVQRMLVYYELASKIFISNVVVQVAERHLIDGLRTVFDTAELIQMDKRTVTSLAAEDEHNRTKRDDLERKVTGLKKAHDDCLAIAMANGQKPDQQSEPGMINADSKEDLDQPTHPQRRKHANTETIRQSPISMSKNIPERPTMTSHRSRPPMKVRKIEPKSELSIRGDGSVSSESELGMDWVSKWDKRNGVANRTKEDRTYQISYASSSSLQERQKVDNDVSEDGKSSIMLNRRSARDEITELWDDAYRSLSEHNNDLVVEYEMAIESWIAIDISSLTSSVNPVGKGSRDSTLYESTRRDSLEQMIRVWLERRDHHGSRMQAAILLFKRTAGTMFDRTPEALIAWVAACFSAETLFNTQNSFQSIWSEHVDILTRIEWYSRLARLLFSSDITDEEDTELSKQTINGFKRQLIMSCRTLLLHLVIIPCLRTSKGKSLVEGIHWSAYDDVKQEKALVASVNGDQINHDLQQFIQCFENDVIRAKSIVSLSDFTGRFSEDSASGYPQIVGPTRLPEADPKTLERMYHLLSRAEEYSEFWNGDSSDGSRVLWVSGTPGCGKTNFLLAIAKLLSLGQKNDANAPKVASYFFNHGNGVGNNISSAAQQLVQQMSSDFHTTQSPANFHILAEELGKILQRETATPVYFILDGLDECLKSASDDAEITPALARFLKFISATLALKSNVKWIVSLDSTFITDNPELTFIKAPKSPVTDDKQHLDVAPQPINNELKLITEELATYQAGALHLDLGREAMNDGLILVAEELATYKVNALFEGFNSDVAFRSQVEKTLLKKSGANLLWISLACSIIKTYGAPWNSLRILEGLKDKIEDLYATADKRLENLALKDPDYCKSILMAMAATYRPLRISELRNLVTIPPEVDLEALITENCQCYLEIRDQIVYIIHSAGKSHLRNLLNETPDHCQRIALRVLSTLSGNLKIYSAGSSDLIKLSIQEHYATSNWIYHLTQIKSLLLGDAIANILIVFFKTQLIRWIDIATPIYPISRITNDLLDLENFLKNLSSRQKTENENENAEVEKDKKAVYSCILHVEDAIRFLRFHYNTGSPTSVNLKNSLLFYPSSIIRRELLLSEFPWLSNVPATEKNTSRILLNLEGHKDWVRCCAYSPDGKVIASASDDRTIRLWDTYTGTSLGILKGSSYWVFYVTISSSGLVATISNNNIDIWDISTQTWRKTLHRDSILQEKHLENGFHDLTFSVSGDKLATALDYIFVVWTILDYQPSIYSTHQNDETIGCLRFSSDGSLAVAYSTKITIWDLADKDKPIRTLCGHTDSISALNFSLDGQLLASGSGDHTVRIWNPVSGEIITIYDATSAIRSVSFSFDSSQIASATRDSIRIWDFKNRSREDQYFSLQGHQRAINSVHFTPRGEFLLASGSNDSTVRIWDTTYYSEEAQLAFGEPCAPQNMHHSAVNFITFSKNGHLLASASEGGSICVWNGFTGKHMKTLGEHSNTILWLKFSPCGKSFVSSDMSYQVIVWDTATWEPQQILQGHDDWARCVIFSPDGKQIASASDDTKVRLWNVRLPNNDEEDINTQATRIFPNGSSWVFTVAFSADANQLASGDEDGTIRIWNLLIPDSDDNTQLQIFKSYGSSLRTIAFSPTGKHIILSANQHLAIWDIDSKVCLTEFQDDGMDFVHLSWTELGNIYTERGIHPASNQLEFHKLPQAAEQLLKSNAEEQSLQLPKEERYTYGLKVEDDETWITRGKDNLIFIPEKYAPNSSGYCSVWIHDSGIAIGCESGLVMLFKFAEMPPIV